jgi:hypothetical protein
MQGDCKVQPQIMYLRAGFQLWANKKNHGAGIPAYPTTKADAGEVMWE